MPETYSSGAAASGKAEAKTRPPVRVRPKKPIGFPLFPHQNGQWAKKINQKMYYFGPWEDVDGALQRFARDGRALAEGRKPRPDPGEMTVRRLGDEFLESKLAAVRAGEITERTYAEYEEAVHLLDAQFGLRRLAHDAGPDDFAAVREKLVMRLGPVRLGNVIQRIRTVFKWGLDNNLLAKPPCYGQSFRKPSAKTLRLHRASKGLKMFSPEEIKRMLGEASVPLEAMILLAVNCGFGNADCGTLRLQALDLKRGWVEHPRPKTGVPRRCPLWPQTVQALRTAIERRPEPNDAADLTLVFVTKHGRSWFKNKIDNPVAKEMRKLLVKCRIEGTLHNRAFYALRHTFFTVAEDKDPVAARTIMGHVQDDMASVYREKVEDRRLKAVVDHVAKWLFGGD